MQKVDPGLLEQLAEREPRSTIGLAAAFSARDPRSVRAVRAGRSCCLLIRSKPLVWLGYPNLLEPADAPELAAVIEATPVVGLDGHPDDMDALLPHLTRAGHTARFRRSVVPADQCGWAASDPTTRMATPLDLEALEELFTGYEVQMVTGTRYRRRYLEHCISTRGAIVHTGASGIDGAVLTGGLTPGFLVFEHLRVAPESRGQGISWTLVSRVVEIAQSYGVGMLGSIVKGNPMSIPEDRGHLETQVSVNLSLPDRVPGERRSRRLAMRVSRAMFD